MPPLRCCICYHCHTLFYLLLISIILLRDCVIGFHKRKKNSRNEAQKQQQHDILRRKLSEEHKKVQNHTRAACPSYLYKERAVWVNRWDGKTSIQSHFDISKPLIDQDLKEIHDFCNRWSTI
ncbi:hypothetical protein PIB30_011407 [Stylosanthes scabra]|uniref:Uncharacterized protein n=1 Tax=Stylosanthes scabra TaxID=79078 RepID=A0ABU6Z4B5_9FABA|nr:hypothetical protein [Stylosanthes scabra]